MLPLQLSSPEPKWTQSEVALPRFERKKNFVDFFKAKIRLLFLIDGTFVYSFSSNLGENLPPEMQK